MMPAATASDLRDIADFDFPFRVSEDGGLYTAPGFHAPEVFHDEQSDIVIYSDEWEALNGYTGQYSYHGAVMHPSEFLGGRLAFDILATPGVYVVTSVEVDGEPDSPAGWCVLRSIS